MPSISPTQCAWDEAVRSRRKLQARNTASTSPGERGDIFFATRTAGLCGAGNITLKSVCARKLLRTEASAQPLQFRSEYAQHHFDSVIFQPARQRRPAIEQMSRAPLLVYDSQVAVDHSVQLLDGIPQRVTSHTQAQVYAVGIEALAAGPDITTHSENSTGSQLLVSALGLHWSQYPHFTFPSHVTFPADAHGF